MRTQGPYIVEGDLLLTRYEWAGGIRPSDKDLADRRRECGVDQPLEVVTPVAVDLPEPTKAEQLIALRAAAPMRSKKPQDGLVGLDLFEARLL